jgi:hypothetical protein
MTEVLKGIGHQNDGSLSAFVVGTLISIQQDIDNALIKHIPTDMGVHSRETIVQQRNIGVMIDDSRHGYASLLSSTQVNTTFSNLALISIGEQGQVMFQAARLHGHLVEFFFIARFSKQNVPLDSVVHDKGLLIKIGHFPADPQLSRNTMDFSQNGSKERRLSRADASHNSNEFSLLAFEIDTS